MIHNSTMLATSRNSSINLEKKYQQQCFRLFNFLPYGPALKHLGASWKYFWTSEKGGIEEYWRNLIETLLMIFLSSYQFLDSAKHKVKHFLIVFVTKLYKLRHDHCNTLGKSQLLDLQNFQHSLYMHGLNDCLHYVLIS